MPQAYQVTCSQCRELRWPYLSERPRTYVCVRCRSGVGAARREAGRKRERGPRSLAVASYRKLQAPRSGSRAIILLLSRRSESSA
jgi:hypothetical protein